MVNNSIHKSKDKICKLAACKNSFHAKGYCNLHYRRFKKYGDPTRETHVNTGCNVEGCDKPFHSKGYCKMHKTRMLRNGTVDKRETIESCTIAGCRSKHLARGYCQAHYKKWRVYGNPLEGKTYNMHGMDETPEYSVWKSMKSRCSNSNSETYKNYGGRGIKVKFKDFNEFIDDVGIRPEGSLTIDRIDNDKHYEPGNVRWATREVQANNSRPKKNFKFGTRYLPARNKFVTHILINGKKTYLGYFGTKEEGEAAYKAAHRMKQIEISNKGT